MTFTADLAQGIIHLLTNEAPYGVYNLSGEGPVMSWAQVAKRVFELCGRDPEDVTEVTTEEYFAAVRLRLVPCPRRWTCEDRSHGLHAFGFLAAHRHLRGVAARLITALTRQAPGTDRCSGPLLCPRSRGCPRMPSGDGCEWERRIWIGYEHPDR